jgi:hypothetical protein
MSVTPEMILQVRYELADTELSLPILSDDEYAYFLNKNNESIRRASLDAAKTILFKLSMSSSRRTVDILSIDSSRTASNYREALMAYIKNPDLSNLLGDITPYAGGISKSDMALNEATSDNNYVKPPVVYTDITTLVF